MNTYKLSYYKAANDSDDTDDKTFTSPDERKNYILENLKQNLLDKKECVYLVGVQSVHEATLITQFMNRVVSFALDENMMNESHIFIFEEVSYQAAYKMALDWAEPDKLCYSN